MVFGSLSRRSQLVVLVRTVFLAEEQLSCAPDTCSKSGENASLIFRRKSTTFSAYEICKLLNKRSLSPSLTKTQTSPAASKCHNLSSTTVAKQQQRRSTWPLTVVGCFHPSGESLGNVACVGSIDVGSLVLQVDCLKL
mmetsp:Transcript_3234/g.5201  ORF Transcript_3234/g.5201 Transcript_3234/m.5201 type:complete len:138 (+) Transcript_3234:458-871(+)